MAIFRAGKFVLLAFVLFSIISSNQGEIHRIRKSSVHHKVGSLPPKGQQGTHHQYQEQTKDEVVDDDNVPVGLLEDSISQKNDYICALLATVLVGLTGILPLALPIDTKRANDETDEKRKLNLFLSFAVGGLLGDVFLHLLPEAFSHFKPEDRSARVRHGTLLISGLLLFLVLEVIFKDEEEKEETKEEKVSLQKITKHSSVETNGHLSAGDGHIKHRKGLKNGLHSSPRNGYKRDINANKVKHSHRNHNSKKGKAVPEKKQVTGYLNLLANFIDNFTHGLAVGGSFMVGPKVGWHTTLAILLHEAPHEIGDFAILLRSGFSRFEAAKAQMSTAVGGLVGCTVALLAESAEIAGTSSAWILPFTSGGFLNIALVTVVPDLMEETSVKESTKQVLSLLLGVAAMAFVNVVSHQ